MLDESKKPVGAATAAQASAASAPGAPAGLMHDVLDMLSGQGLANLVQTMKEKGFTQIVASWVGTGENLPISAAQIQSALGNEKIAQLAQKVGLSQEEAATHLSTILPQVVDKLTPNGKVEGGGIIQQGIAFLKSKLS